MNKRKTIHGIDLTAPGGVQALLDFHRCTFGDAQMNAGGEGGDGGTGGNGGQGGDPAGSGDPAGAGAGTPPAAPATPPAGAPDPKDGEDDQEPWNDPVKAKAAIERLQRDAASANGKARDNARATAAQEAESALVQKLGKALGLVKDGDEKPDADALTKQLTDQTTTAKQAQLELAVFKAAGKPALGADAAALLDSRSFLEKIGDLDPSKADDIEAAIKKAIEDNPKLKASQAAAKGSAEIGGGSGEQRTNKPGSLADAVAGHYNTN
ncbi:hypothetical protein [Citricoccus sp.]|uniref:hypothetical protein n=1 Tax=Citricoccus sp. TaxID=1978372 RepID=UPI0028BE160B|nr:hypothetical protein [Citricoccus sp.]